jgi:hypothetical protein
MFGRLCAGQATSSPGRPWPGRSAWLQRDLGGDPARRASRARRGQGSVDGPLPRDTAAGRRVRSRRSISLWTVPLGSTSRSWCSTLPGTGWPASPQRADGAVRGSGCELLAHGSLRLLPVEILDHQIGLGGAVERRAPSELTDEFCRRYRSVLAIPAKPVSTAASSREDQDMSFQAYLDMIEDKYGLTHGNSLTRHTPKVRPGHNGR